MKHPDPTLATPLYVKTDPAMPWPAEERCFHMMAREGLFICRNNRYFSSAVPASNFPSSLAEQSTFCRIRYPKLPRRAAGSGRRGGRRRDALSPGRGGVHRRLSAPSPARATRMASATGGRVLQAHAVLQLLVR